MAEVERDEINGRYIYRIHSDYDKDSIAMEPGELMALLRWLQEHEGEITNDTLSNRVQDEMRGW